MFVPAQLLRNSRQQRPSNQVDLDSSVSGDAGTLLQRNGTAYELISEPCYDIVADFRFTRHSVYAVCT